MIQQAISCDDPVVFFEPKRRYHDKGEVDESLDPDSAPPMGQARVVTDGQRRHARGLRATGKDGP
jgi:2-oxoisovalerate dehydrogenase E1 component beta subunit